jgi:hypothetical protein
VSNAERRNSATLEYLLRLAAVRDINLHWLITGQGAMRTGEADGSPPQEKLHLALAEALRAAYGALATPRCRWRPERARSAPARRNCARSGSPPKRCLTPMRFRSFFVSLST